MDSKQLYDRILAQISDRPVNASLTDIVLLAKELGDQDLERWAKLELGGYVMENPARREDDKLPEYRCVAGQYIDPTGTPIIIADPEWQFIQKDYLNNPASELEGLASKPGMLRRSNPGTIAILSQKLGLHVIAFQFSPSAVSSILDGIRSKTIELLHQREHLVHGPDVESLPAEPAQQQVSEDIVEVKPNFFGLGLNLNAAYHKFRNRKKRI